MSKIIGIGPHYHSLLKSKDMKFTSEPLIFIKPTTSIIKSGEPIIIPSKVDKIVAEVEIAVKINRRVRDVPVKELDISLIEGFALANDITAFGESVYGQGKLYDTFTPLGEFVRLTDFSTIHFESYNNDQLKQTSNTTDMGLNFLEQISYISSLLTIEEGDIILTGTPAGPFEFQKGDTIGMKSLQLGVLENVVI